MKIKLVLSYLDPVNFTHWKYLFRLKINFIGFKINLNWILTFIFELIDRWTNFIEFLNEIYFVNVKIFNFIWPLINF